MATTDKPNEPTVLDAFFFAGPAGVVGLVIYDNGYTVKATTAPLPPIVYAGMTTAEAERLDTERVLRDGAPFPLSGALAMSGAARAAHAKYAGRPPADPNAEWLSALRRLLEAITSATPSEWAEAVTVLKGLATAMPNPPRPPWSSADLMVIMQHGPAARLKACGCSVAEAQTCWQHFGGSKNLACHWRAAGWAFGNKGPAPFDPPLVEDPPAATTHPCGCNAAQQSKCMRTNHDLTNPGCMRNWSSWDEGG